jgi:FMN phosphatase YigB (HAD superfamily)
MRIRNLESQNRKAISEIRAVLLDLDDTLLINPMSKFIPKYFNLICKSVADLVPPEVLTTALMEGTRAMQHNADRSRTNRQVFYEVFFRRVGVERKYLEPRLAGFYRIDYPQLSKLTRPAPGNRQLVEHLFERGFQVVVATNPLFPRNALEQRLDWAGVPVTEFDYDLVTTFENMHSAKPDPDYYREILKKIDRLPKECLMVGDDWERDMVPASTAGVRRFWICNGESVQWPGSVDGPGLIGKGSLLDLLEWFSQSPY